MAFDMDGDGVLEQIAWTLPGEEVAFLAIDRDGDGQITSGKELFGNYTVPRIRNGFAALAKMATDLNGGAISGSLSADDALFGRLLLAITTA